MGDARQAAKTSRPLWIKWWWAYLCFYKGSGTEKTFNRCLLNEGQLGCKDKNYTHVAKKKKNIYIHIANLLGFVSVRKLPRWLHLGIHLPRQETGVQSWMGKIPWRWKRQPTSVSLPGESHEQRSLAVYSPLGCKRVVHDLVTRQQQKQQWLEIY